MAARSTRRKSAASERERQHRALACWLLAGHRAVAQERGEAEKRAIAFVEKLGGKVTYDD